MSYATSIQAVSTCHIVAVPQKFVNRIVDHVNAVNFGKNGRKKGDGPDRLLFEMINIKHSNLFARTHIRIKTVRKLDFVFLHI